jgi:hypothetical protein
MTPDGVIKRSIFMRNHVGTLELLGCKEAAVLSGVVARGFTVLQSLTDSSALVRTILVGIIFAGFFPCCAGEDGGPDAESVAVVFEAVELALLTAVVEADISWGCCSRWAVRCSGSKGCWLGGDSSISVDRRRRNLSNSCLRSSMLTGRACEAIHAIPININTIIHHISNLGMSNNIV